MNNILKPDRFMKFDKIAVGFSWPVWLKFLWSQWESMWNISSNIYSFDVVWLQKNLRGIYDGKTDRLDRVEDGGLVRLVCIN